MDVSATIVINLFTEEITRVVACADQYKKGGDAAMSAQALDSAEGLGDSSGPRFLGPHR